MARQNPLLIVSLVALLGAAAGCATRVYETRAIGGVTTDAPTLETLAAPGTAEPAAPVALVASRASGPALSLVFLPEPNEPLPVREDPAQDAAVIGHLDAFALDVPSTGRVIEVHDVEWVEVVHRAGLGWIPRAYTTEWVPAEDFCASTEVERAVLGELAAAIEDKNVDRLDALVSPTHGLRVSVVRGETQHLQNLFSTAGAEMDQPLDWGTDPMSGEAVSGSFDEVVGAPVARALARGDVTCNRLVVGTASVDAHIPDSHVNLNFYNVHVPATDELGMSWESWTVGVVVLESTAFVATLSRYGWEG